MIKRIARTIAALLGGAPGFPDPIKPIPNIQEPARPAPGTWTRNALDTLHQWELSVVTLELMGAMSEQEARRQVEYIDRLRKDLLFNQTGAREKAWKPGAEHLQPHPVKENEDGTLYYKHAVYRKIGDHGGRQRRRVDTDNRLGGFG